MSRFEGDINIRLLDMRPTGWLPFTKRRWYKLLSDVVYHSDYLGMKVVIPAGFETDLASVPIHLQPLVQKDEGVVWPALPHDFLYTLQSPFHGITRRDADLVLLEAMTVCGVGPIKRGLVYHAVRLGGTSSWKKR